MIRLKVNQEARILTSDILAICTKKKQKLVGRKSTLVSPIVNATVCHLPPFQEPDGKEDSLKGLALDNFLPNTLHLLSVKSDEVTNLLQMNDVVNRQEY